MQAESHKRGDRAIKSASATLSVTAMGGPPQGQCRGLVPALVSRRSLISQVGGLEHLYEGVAEGGAEAVLAASIFHFGEFTVREAKEYLRERGVEVRL